MSIYRLNRSETHPPYQTPCLVHTQSGEEYEAELIHLNPRYHTHVNPDVWKVRGKKKYLEYDEVVEWRLAIDI